ESDLVVTGHAEARFTYRRGGVIFDQDTQVLETAQAVATDFARTIQPKLTDCLARQLKASGKGTVVSVDVKPLDFPHVGSVGAAVATADPLDPKSRIVAADQARAVAALLTRADLGAGWAGGQITPVSLKAPRCPALQPSFHDLTLTGHAESSFHLDSAGWQV